jgi:hypothetical protein
MRFVLNTLCERWVREKKLWRLSLFQLSALLLLSAWPWLVEFVSPGNDGWALASVFLFMPFAYIGGSLFASVLPAVSLAYPFGVSLTIFLIAYLVLVSWRQRNRD